MEGGRVKRGEGSHNVNDVGQALDGRGCDNEGIG